MSCTRCGCFPRSENTLCLCCRTIGRLRELVEAPLLCRDQEQEALTILRVAAGALLDLAELAAPRLAAERVAANPPGYNSDPLPSRPPVVAPPVEPIAPETGRPSAPEVSAVKREGDIEEGKEPLAEVHEDIQDDAPAPVEEDKKAGIEEKAAPNRNPGAEKKKRKRHRSSKKAGEAEKKPKRKRKAKREESKGVEEQESTQKEVAQVEKEPDWSGLVESDPSFLGPAPIPKGSVASHFSRLPPPPPAPVRSGPVEPSYPPPHHASADRPRSPSRSPSWTIQRRPRGTKGVKHRERGYNWRRY